MQLGLVRAAGCYCSHHIPQIKYKQYSKNDKNRRICFFQKMKSPQKKIDTVRFHCYDEHKESFFLFQPVVFCLYFIRGHSIE